MNDVEIIEKEIGRGWTAKKIASATLSGITATVVAATKTVTRAAGSWITDGLQVGDIITFTGFADAGNNVDYTVVTVSALTITGTTAAAMVNVTADEGVGGAISTKAVTLSRCKLGRLLVLTPVITVTPQNNTADLWDAVSDAAELNLEPCPIEVPVSLKLTFSADGEAWVLYK